MNSKRQQQIGELIKRSFSNVLQQQGIYIYGDALVTVTSVQVSPDLSMAKIYLSIYNTENKDQVLTQLIHHTHPLKQELASRIRNQVRRIPQIYFYRDEIVDEMYHVDELFEKIKTAYPASKSGEEE